MKHYARDLLDIGGVILDGDTGGVAGDWQDVALFEEWKSMNPMKLDDVRLSKFMSGYRYIRREWRNRRLLRTRKEARVKKTQIRPQKKRGDRGSSHWP